MIKLDDYGHAVPVTELVAVIVQDIDGDPVRLTGRVLGRVEGAPEVRRVELYLTAEQVVTS